MTKEERRLWYDFLRTHSLKFRRQAIIGRYIADFYCPQAKLIIELDGSQHYEDEAVQKDKERTYYLGQYGLKIIRIQNIDINNNFYEVCEYLEQVIKQQIEI